MTSHSQRHNLTYVIAISAVAALENMEPVLARFAASRRKQQTAKS